MIYFDNAATTGKKPESVVRAINYAMLNYCANPGRSGHSSSEAAADMIYKTREKISDFFGADGPENVAFTANCTHSLNFVIKGVLTPKDHVIVSSLEHNAVMRPLVKSGVDYSCAQVSFFDDNETLKNIEACIKSNTKMILCTGASNVLGKTLPIEKIGMLCRERGLLFGVDAAQTAGVLPIDMKKMSIDYLCIAPHKGLYAPMGTGILICRKPLENTVIEGGTGTESYNFAQPSEMPEQCESGTVNVPGIAGISAGIDYVKKIGLDKIYNHEMQLCGWMYNALKNSGKAILYTPFPQKGLYAPIVSFNIADMPSGEVAAKLNKKGIAVRAGLHCAATAHREIGTRDVGVVRVSPAIFNTFSEAKRLIGVVEHIKKD